MRRDKRSNWLSRSSIAAQIESPVGMLNLCFELASVILWFMFCISFLHLHVLVDVCLLGPSESTSEFPHPIWGAVYNGVSLNDFKFL